jgi:alkylation response protein AidB-like acyl-CoA dehydrogenase
MTAAGAGWLLGETAPDAVFVPEEFGSEALALARAAAEFVEGEIVPQTPAIERQEPGLMPKLLKQAGDLGLMGFSIPQEHGGLGLDVLTYCLLAEQMARQASFAVSHGAHSCIGSLPLVYFGTDDQKRKYLPRLASGEWIGAFALSEAGYGSDALGAATRARLSADGSHYVLNGTKMWTSNAGFADLITVFAQVELPEGGEAPAGRTFSAFLVERGFPGVSIGREEHKLGIKGSSTCRVILEDAPVPAENLLHAVGRGHVVALNILNAGRLKLGVGLLGPARDLLRISARYANERRQMGHPISHFGLIRHKLAEQAIRIYALESACYRVAAQVVAAAESGAGGEDRTLPPLARAFEEYLVECAMMKVLGSETIDYIVDEALQIHGGYGYTEEFPIARAYRDARINRIFEGTNEINRLTISGTLMRRAQRGRFPLLKAVQQAQEELLAPSTLPGFTEDRPMGEELGQIAEARKLVLVASGFAGQKWGAGLGEQQEVLGALSDMTTDLFTAESAVLRAAKLAKLRPGDRSALAGAMARVVLAGALDRIEAGARLVLSAAAAGDELRSQLALLRRFSRRLPADTIALRRSVAAAVIDAERYPLSVV